MIVKVIDIKKIEQKDDIEEVIIENDSKLTNCLVSKGLFKSGDQGYYFSNGTKIKITKDYPWSSSFLKVNNGVYRVRSIKYNDKMYEGLLMNLKEFNIDFYENLVVKEVKRIKEVPKFIPKYNEIKIRKVEDLIIKDTSKCYFYKTLKNFFRTNLYIKKYMPESTLVICYSKKDGTNQALTRNSVVCENSYVSKIIKKEKVMEIIDKQDLAIYGQVYNGKIYVVKIYDLNSECFYTIKDLIYYCTSNRLEHGYSAIYEQQFTENNIHELFYLFDEYKKYGDNPNYMVVVNNVGDMLKIKNKNKSFFSSLTSPFTSTNNFKFIKGNCCYENKQNELPFVKYDNNLEFISGLCAILGIFSISMVFIDNYVKK